MVGHKNMILLLFRLKNNTNISPSCVLNIRHLYLVTIIGHEVSYFTLWETLMTGNHIYFVSQEKLLQFCEIAL